MIVNGLFTNNGHGRPSDKVQNLRKFTEQWAEFADAEALEFNEGDANFISGALHLGDGTLDRYHQLANNLEV
jgi:hypothetical protein